MRLRADVAIFDIIGHLVLWLILSIVTFGIALFFSPTLFLNSFSTVLISLTVTA
ncbi:hypothetical protein M9196_07025 [Vibrio sp. S4B1]|nr:DUF6693 family protein [Vibrio methylphosphonaticus]MCL9774474.1 hypothetical protein [Vibrio methylphosphonaticus]